MIGLETKVIGAFRDETEAYPGHGDNTALGESASRWPTSEIAATPATCRCPDSGGSWPMSGGLRFPGWPWGGLFFPDERAPELGQSLRVHRGRRGGLSLTVASADYGGVPPESSRR